MDLKIIFSDIDGTLLDSGHRIPEETREAIRRLGERGIPFVLVSARMPEAMTGFRDEIGLKAPMVCYSGGLVMGAGGEVLYNGQMELEAAAGLKELVAREFPEVRCGAYGGGIWLVDDDRDPWIRKEEEITGVKAQAGDMRDVFQAAGGINKFLLMGEENVIERTEQRLKEMYPQLSIARSKDVYLEVMDGKVSKAAGAEAVCRHYGFSLKEAVAFGDGYNDIDMLKACGIGYAMGNAPEAVKTAADRVTLDHDRQGLLVGLRQVFGGGC